VKISRLKALVPYILSLAALFVFLGYVWRHADRYRQLLDLSAGPLLALLGLALFGLISNGFINYLLYLGLDVPLTLNEAVGLAAINTLANQLPFAGGLIAKGVYLKQKYELNYARYLSATLALYLCFVAASGVMGIAVLAFWALWDGIGIPVPLLLGFTGMAASISLLWLPIRANTLPGRLGKHMIQLLDGWQVLRRKPSLTWKLIGLQLLMTLLFAGRLWIAFHALSQEVTLTQCLLFSAAVVLTHLVSIAPGGLGVREAIVASVASAFGFDVAVSVMASAIDRGIETAVVVALGTIYTYILSKQASNTQPETGPTKH
jgi:uncharacterized membrane protein YbhN (UPF0104 family)